MTDRYRRVLTGLWTDPKVRLLPADGKLLFLYLITSGHGHVSGLYLLPIAPAARETGLSARRIRELLRSESIRELVCFDPEMGTVWVRAMLRHQGSGSKIGAAVAEQVRALSDSSLSRDLVASYRGGMPNLVNALRDTASDAGSDEVSDASFPQEQDQDQERTRARRKRASGETQNRLPLPAALNGQAVEPRSGGDPLIGHWIEERERATGLGRERSYGRHCSVVKDLRGRVKGDEEAARRAISLFFTDDHQLKQKNGASIGTFQALLERYASLAMIRKPVSAGPEVTLAEAKERDEAEIQAQLEARTRRKERKDSGG